eukprot:TRINITY_DN4035_c0_g1_i6.p1 TRINITY_DN4035_c0_g1~~TRINITY_DN4035_c0_g1_i6.p1  ORF type:complete len:253 (-),score=39.22 TRINITY_DN4035_c0_g1_i6:116-874(-)
MREESQNDRLAEELALCWQASSPLKQTIAQQRDADMSQVEKLQDVPETYVDSNGLRLPGMESNGNIEPATPNAPYPALSENERGAGSKRNLVINKKFQPHKKGGLQTIVVNKLGGDSMLFDLPSRATIFQLREIIAAQQKCSSSRVHLFADDGELLGNQHAPPEVNMMLYNGGEWQGGHDGVEYELSVAGNHFRFSCSNNEMRLEGLLARRRWWGKGCSFHVRPTAACEDWCLCKGATSPGHSSGRCLRSTK